MQNKKLFGRVLTPGYFQYFQYFQSAVLSLSGGRLRVDGAHGAAARRRSRLGCSSMMAAGRRGSARTSPPWGDYGRNAANVAGAGGDGCGGRGLDCGRLRRRRRRSRHGFNIFNIFSRRFSLCQAGRGGGGCIGTKCPIDSGAADMVQFAPSSGKVGTDKPKSQQ